MCYNLGMELKELEMPKWFIAMLSLGAIVFFGGILSLIFGPDDNRIDNCLSLCTFLYVIWFIHDYAYSKEEKP